MKKYIIHGIVLFLVWFVVWTGVSIFLDVVIFNEGLNLFPTMIAAAAGGIVFSVIFTIFQRKKICK